MRQLAQAADLEAGERLAQMPSIRDRVPRNFTAGASVAAVTPRTLAAV